MLQVKNLVKRYTTKGETVTALDHVSVRFPEKGMVFLLGKSGSGKSTLLNVSGGLDTPDEGEIIVNGKSSKDFSASDFDSYRNTYVGFIFQEYNILSELTVAENVALALELQGKPCDAEQVNALLRQVDLEGYGDRRPNTLSGGQKQRVAIARALVKNPEIIMADEPTGALDSATGKQVFDTLKKLSQEKLVVIVSHDRDFAESYADRIIELRDGRIVSDVTRGGENAEGGNLTELSEKKLTVSCGAALSEEDERRILGFLRKTKGSVVISSEKEDIDNVPVGGAGIGFSRTVEPELEERKDESKFIKSEFPVRYAVKMGLSGLRLKPIRLIFTTLLATIAFIVFGIFSTLITYDTVALGSATLAETSYSAAVIRKFGILHMQNGEKEYTAQLSTGLTSSHFSQEEILALREQYPKMNFIPAYTLNLSGLGFSVNQSENGGDFYSCISAFTAFADASYLLPYLNDGTGEVMTLAAGAYPADQSECLVSRVVYESFSANGYVLADGTQQKISSYDDLIGKQIRILGSNSRWIYLNISGIVETYEDFSHYDVLRGGLSQSGMTAKEYKDVQSALQETYQYSMSSLCFVGEGFYEKYADYDLYVNGNRSAIAISKATSDSHFVSSNYLVREVAERETGESFIRYTLNEEAEAEGSYVQYLFASLRENRDYKSKTLMRLDAKEYAETDVSYAAPYSFMSDIRTSRETFNRIFAVLGSVAVVLAVFAALLLFNFISASINAKKKDIGILRAVGARGIDVFKIFIVEGVAITLFCFLLGCLGSAIACTVTNAILLSKEVLTFKLFSFGWMNVLIVLVIAFATSVIATAVPVALTVRKKPVEAIRSV